MVSSVATIQTQACEQCHYETVSKLSLTFSSSNAARVQAPLCVVTSCWLYFRMHVFAFKALRRSVPGPLPSPALRHCFLLCHQWSLYSPLYFGAVMTLFTSIGTTVTPYLAADNVNLPFKMCHTLTSFTVVTSHLCFQCFLFRKKNPFISLQIFLYFLFLC